MNINTLKRFNLIPNSKNPTAEWAKKNRQKCFRTGIFTGNAGVPTGKVNNITVVDLDFYKITGENKFTSEFKDYITEFDTFTVQTGSGGFHLYFKYDEDIKQTVNDTFHIDIRSDGGYVVSPDSIVDGSGSIAIACHNLGFDLTACELDTDYYNAAMKRLKQHQAQLRLI